MVPNKFIIEHDGALYGPFETPADAAKYATAHEWDEFSVLKLYAV